MSRRALVTFILGFFALLTTAWLLHQLLVFGFHWWSADSAGINLAYWVIMKFLVWVVYPWLYWRKRLSVTPAQAGVQGNGGLDARLRGHDNAWGSTTVREFIGLSPTTMKRGYTWGVVTAVVWVVLLFLVNLITHKSFVGVDNWAMYIYVITLTPIFEEIMFRGFILSGLLALKIDGKIVNLITTVLFLLVHGLGWAFQGVFLHNLASTAWISVTLFSLLAGFIRIHSGSLRASILLHMGNNAFSGLLG